jgi:Icc-related predicted phosphoesterase
MEILLVSDLHYTLRQLDWVLDQADSFDAVVLAGDHLDISSTVPLESQIVVMQTYIRKLAAATTTIVASGNHDLTGRNAHGEKAALWIGDRCDTAVADWGRLDVGDLRITVCPWWDGPETRADVEAQLDRDAQDRPRSWLWVYHYPPDEAPVSWTGRRHIGDRDLNEWIARYRPDLVLTGHIHDSPFRDGGSWIAGLGETWVINAGTQPGPIPAHAIIDTEAGTADWWSPYGQEQRQLWPAA